MEKKQEITITLENGELKIKSNTDPVTTTELIVTANKHVVTDLLTNIGQMLEEIENNKDQPDQPEKQDAVH